MVFTLEKQFYSKNNKTNNHEKFNRILIDFQYFKCSS